MKKKQRKSYTAAFKVKIALEAIKGQRTINEIAAHYDVHPNQVTQWKKQAIESLPDVFSTTIRMITNIIAPDSGEILFLRLSFRGPFLRILRGLLRRLKFSGQCRGWRRQGDQHRQISRRWQCRAATNNQQAKKPCGPFLHLYLFTFPLDGCSTYSRRELRVD